MNPTDESATNVEDTGDIISTLGFILIFLSTTIASYFLAKSAPPLIQKAWQGFKPKQLNIIDFALRILKTAYFMISDFYVLYYSIYGYFYI